MECAAVSVILVLMRGVEHGVAGLLLSVLCRSCAVSIQAQEAWPPPLPDLPRAARVAAAGARPLQPAVLEQLLPKLLERNFHGLGAEARRVLTWRIGKDAVGLRQERGAWELEAPAGGVLGVSEGLAAALIHADQYFGMTPATLAKPPSHAELEAAALSPEGVESVTALFERTIADRLATPTGIVVPEIGGEGTLDGGLRLHDIPDLTRPALREIAGASGDLAELAGIYARYPDAMKIIDDNGLLGNLLRLMPGWQARGMPGEQQGKLVRQVVDTVLRNTSDSYLFDPASQFDAIVSQDWSGRYVGRWHTHPPAAGISGWGPGDVPSGPDMDIAVRDGQNLVFSFQPDGFDLYDLSPLAGAKPDLSRVLKTSFRSAAWRLRFQLLHDAAFPRHP